MHEAVYTGAYTAEIWIDPDPEISAISIHRPARDPEFWDALFLVLRETSAVLYWPDLGRSACVANPAAIAEMPPDIIESVGIPAVVASGADIALCVRFGADFFEDNIDDHPDPEDEA